MESTLDRPDTLTAKDIQQIRHENMLMRNRIQEDRNKIQLLENLAGRTVGDGADPGQPLPTMDLESFLHLFGKGRDTNELIRGDDPPATKVSPEQLAAFRKREQSKYEMIYLGKAGMPDYGATSHWLPVWMKLLSMNIKSLMDVGTGLGGLPRQLYRETEIEHAAGIDFAMQPDRVTEKHHVTGDNQSYRLQLLRASAHAIPTSDKTFEWVTAFDMMEHLVPEEVDEVIREFQRVAIKGLIFNISYFDSITKVRGASLHKCVRPRAWWIKTLKRVTGWDVWHYNKFIFVTAPGIEVPDLARPMEYFFETDAPEEVILLGKGPSLDRWKKDWQASASLPVMGINEAMTECDCAYGIYSDAVMTKLSPPSHVAIIRPSFLNHSHGDCESFVYDRAEYGAETCSTASIALLVLATWGVKKVLMVGFDAYDTPLGPVYAECVSGMLSKRCSSDFSFVNETIDLAIQTTGIEVEWWHRQFKESSDGE